MLKTEIQKIMKNEKILHRGMEQNRPEKLFEKLFKKDKNGVNTERG